MRGNVDSWAQLCTLLKKLIFFHFLLAVLQCIKRLIFSNNRRLEVFLVASISTSAGQSRFYRIFAVGGVVKWVFAMFKNSFLSVLGYSMLKVQNGEYQA
jgi:hypothetical protein